MYDDSPEAQQARRARAIEREARTYRDADGRIVGIGHPPEMIELERLTVELRAVQSQIAQLQARSARLVARVEELNATDTLSTSAWLAWAAGLTTAEARRQVTLARRLPELPKLSAALDAGEISEGVAATLVKVATPANETLLLEAAEAATGPQLGRLVAEYKPLQPKAPAAGRDPSAEFFESHVDEFGMVDGRFRARADDFAVVESALDAYLEADREDTRTGGDGGGGGGDPMTRLDALVAMATDHLAGLSAAPNVVPQRFQMIVRVDEAALHPDLDDLARAEACLAATCSLDPTAARELACDAGIAALVERDGVAVQVTSPSRFATPAQLVALHARDKTCRYPGCGRKVRLHAHHATPHPVGPTHIDNLVLLCRKHHRKVHRKGWSTRWEHRGTKRVLVVVAPDGAILEPPDPPRGPPPEPPEPGRRRTGTGEPLTAWARDVFYDTWIRADQTGLDQTAAEAEAAARTDVAAEAEAEAAVEPAAALAGDAGPDVTTAA